MKSNLVGIVLELSKAKITFAVTISVATGHFLFVESFGTGVILPALGVFLLACGSATLNQVQEARHDALMERTRNRPIPSGRIGKDWALFIALLFTGGAFYTLSCIETHTATILALAAGAFLWYNAVYTYLKRITPYAVVPGALVGAIPPVIGWASGGGMANDPLILEVAFFFFLWQIPHFWLLLLISGKDYEAAGLPTLTTRFAPEQLARITCMWIVAIASFGLLMAVTRPVGFPWNLGIVLTSLWMAVSAFGVLRRGVDGKTCFVTFMKINFYALSVMVFLSGEALS